MSEVLNRLVELLSLERIEDNLFRGQSQNLGWGTVFGGQVLGQALSAAAQTVPEDRGVHSLHAYFLRPGKIEPIVYEVDRIRDGRSFTTRRVVAIQNGRAIFNMSASFHVHEEGLSHQATAPAAPPPEDLLSERQLAQKAGDAIPEFFRKRATAEKAIETRPVDLENPLKPEVLPPERLIWLRAAAALPDTPALHAYLLAYASDFKLLGTTLRPHGVSWITPGLQIASLDHAMHFHRPFRFDDWLLYAVESPSSSGSRGLARGQVYNRDGVLVASTTQEGLIRLRKD